MLKKNQQRVKNKCRFEQKIYRNVSKVQGISDMMEVITKLKTTA